MSKTVPASDPVSLRTRIGQLLPTLPPSMRRVAEALQARPQDAAELTISELARRCDTSETSVVRFCHSLGVGGYSELRIALATELGRERAQAGDAASFGDDIAADDPLDRVVANIAYTERLAIAETLSGLDLAALEGAVAAVAEARRVLCFGVGASHLAALDLAQKLLRIGRTAHAFTDAHEAMTLAALAGPQDAVVALSHSGATREPRLLLTTALERGARTVVITNVAGSPLAEAAAVVLLTAVRESTFRSGAMASRIAQLAIVDCLFAGVAQRDRAGVVEALATTRAGTERLR